MAPAPQRSTLGPVLFPTHSRSLAFPETPQCLLGRWFSWSSPGAWLCGLGWAGAGPGADAGLGGGCRGGGGRRRSDLLSRYRAGISRGEKLALKRAWL